jgi:hypothetical protein
MVGARKGMAVRYKCDGIGSVTAESLTDAASHFAHLIAGQYYGPGGFCRRLQKKTNLGARSVNFEAFLGVRQGASSSPDMDQNDPT